MDKDDQKAIASAWKLGGLTWRELARRVWSDVYDGDLLTRAAALSYYFLLALFPLLIFLTAMLGYFAESGTQLRRNLLYYLASIAPRTASQLVRATVEEITEGADGGKLSFGLLAAVWFASFGMGAVGDTLNSAYGVRESRPWWRVRLISLGLTVALAALIITALALVLYGGEIGESLAGRYDFGGAFVSVWGVIQWPIVLAFVLFAFALIYYFAPDLRDQTLVLDHARVARGRRALAARLLHLPPLPELLRPLQRHLRVARRGHHPAPVVLPDGRGHPRRGQGQRRHRARGGARGYARGQAARREESFLKLSVPVRGGACICYTPARSAHSLSRDGAAPAPWCFSFLSPEGRATVKASSGTGKR